MIYSVKCNSLPYKRHYNIKMVSIYQFIILMVLKRIFYVFLHFNCNRFILFLPL